MFIYSGRVFKKHFEGNFWPMYVKDLNQAGS